MKKKVIILVLLFTIGIFLTYPSDKTQTKDAEKNRITSIIDKAYTLFKENNYNQALKFYLEALPICEGNAKKNSQELLSIYLFLGRIYLRTPDHPKAIIYFRNGLKFAKQINDLDEIAHFHNQLGLAYDYSDNNSTALKHYKVALKLLKELKDKEKIAILELNIGLIYLEQGKYNQSLNLLENILPIFRKNKNSEILCKILRATGICYTKQRKFDVAESFLMEALSICKLFKDKQLLFLIYGNISNLYYQMSRYKEAFIYQKEFIILKDEIINEKKNKEIVQLQETYEAESRKKEIKLLKKTKRLQLILFILGFLLIAIVLGFFIKKYIHLFAFWKKQKYISQYRLLDLIGSGGMGNIYKALSLRDKTSKVAIKILKEELFKDEKNIKRFKREGMIIDHLNHPHIVKVLERGEDEDKLYIVMEYLEGQSLEKKIKRENPIQISTCIHMMIQICDAIAKIHCERIVHRDLKPANIMVIERDGDPNFVKLLDFGLSKVWYHSRLTDSGILIGTLSYQAPEQVLHHEFSPASDIYSLGQVFHEMLVGIFFYKQGNSMSTMVETILHQIPPPPIKLRKEVPMALNDLILKMLDKDPKQRPSIEKILNLLKNNQ